MNFGNYKIIMILGSQRSGTTMFGQVLGACEQSMLIDESDDLYPWFELLFSNAGVAEVDSEFKELCIRAREKYIHPQERCSDTGKIREHITHLVFQVPNLTYVAEKIARFLPSAACIFPFRDIRDVVVSMEKLDWIPMVENQKRLLEGKTFSLCGVDDDIGKLREEKLRPFEARALIAKIKMSL